MELSELVHKVQQLSQWAGLAFNTYKLVECEERLRELRDLLIDQIIEPDGPVLEAAAYSAEAEQAAAGPAKETSAEAAVDTAEPDSPEPDVPAEETETPAGPEAGPSEE